MAVGRIAFIVTCALVSGGAAYFGQPLVHGNSDAILVIITVLTIFAGFLVAIIAVLGDPAMLPGGSWRVVEGRRGGVYRSVVTHTWLFRLYLVAIALLFAGVLVEKLGDCSSTITLKTWVERGYLFFGVLSFTLTLALPSMLADLQMARVDAELRDRRQKAGLPDD
jgi:hypothetical protein